MRVGIFGGAFDPPHLGHEKAAKAFLEGAQLDLLYIIPSGDPPHKIISSGSRAEDRLSMCGLAFSPISEKIIVSDMEMISDQVSYSYLTAEEISKKHPNDEIFLFVGTDQFLAFETWRNFEYLLSLCTLCVMDRFSDKEKILSQKEHLEKDFQARCLLLEEKPYIISSTGIREELEKEGFSESLSPLVNSYIKKNGIYSFVSDKREAKAILKIKEVLLEERLSHTFGVQREVLRLSKLFSLSEKEKKDLSLAALFHDLTKEWTVEEHKAFLEKRGEALSSEDLLSPAVLHGRSAAYLLGEELSLSEEYQSAVYYHTTGKEEMSLKEKILFFADYIEEMRKHKVCIETRRYFYENLPSKEKDRLSFLDLCIKRVLKQTIDHLQKKELPIHSLTLQAFESLEKTERNGL